MKLPFFSYVPEKSFEVFRETEKFINMNGYLEEIRSVGMRYASLIDLVPQDEITLFSGNLLPLYESWHEIQISFNLCAFGFYKQAMSSLRSALELGVLSIYWNLNDDGHEIIREWSRSREYTPRVDKIWNTIRKHERFSKFDDMFGLKVKYDSFAHLHDYVHSKGVNFSNAFGVSRSNSQLFQGERFAVWYENFLGIAKYLTEIHLIKYPMGIIEYNWSKKFGLHNPSIGILDPHEREEIIRFLDANFVEEIQALIKTDSEIQDTITNIERLPDISEEEVEEQIIEMNKILIRSMGFENWKRSKEVFYPNYSDDKKKRIDDRVELLSAWSKENGY
jgi:hypothetical protein